MVANVLPIELAHQLPAIGLTPDDLAILRKPFAPNEHEFKGGFTYISEEAISNRLDEVDPSWSLVILNQAIRDNHSVTTVRLTVKGVSRDGVGMQNLTITVKGEVKENPSEPEKGAATDALKRAARLFGIGRYLLGIPDNVKDMAALTNWLAPKQAAKSTRRIPNENHNKAGEIEFSAADIEAAMKEMKADWHGYRIDTTTGGHARVVMKDKGEKAAAIEAVAARGIRVIDNAVLANYFDTNVRVYAEPH